MPVNDISGLSSGQVQTLTDDISVLLDKLQQTPTASPEEVQSWINNTLTQGWGEGKGITLAPAGASAGQAADALRLLQTQIQTLAAKQPGAAAATPEDLGNWISQSLTGDLAVSKDPKTEQLAQDIQKLKADPNFQALSPEDKKKALDGALKANGQAPTPPGKDADGPDKKGGPEKKDPAKDADAAQKAKDAADKAREKAEQELKELIQRIMHAQQVQQETLLAMIRNM